MAVGFYTPPFYPLNNLSPHAIEYDGRLYPTAEHAYMAAKLSDHEAKEAIRNARSPQMAKELANVTYKDIRDPEWENKKLSIMEDVIRTKLSQHPEVRQALQDSGDEEIVEDSPTDYFWGEGKDGSGQNHLGKLWMKLRAEL